MFGNDLKSYSASLPIHSIDDSPSSSKRELSPGVEFESKKVKQAVEAVEPPSVAAAPGGMISNPGPGIKLSFEFPFQLGDQIIFLKSQREVDIVKGRLANKKGKILRMSYVFRRQLSLAVGGGLFLNIPH